MPRLAILAFPLILFSLIHPASASSVIDVDKEQVLIKKNEKVDATLEYWTPERLKAAKPMPLPQVNSHAIHEIPASELPQNKINPTGSGDDGSRPKGEVEPNKSSLFTPERLSSSNENNTSVEPSDNGTSNEQFSSSRLVPLTADQKYPYSTVGKLFFTIPNKGDFVCSASVLRPRVILTAGHCVHSGSGGKEGFYSKWLFIPAYRDGNAPYQAWNWSYATVTSTWASGGGTVPNAADYAMLELADRSFSGVTRRIGTVTGYLGYQTQSLLPNHAHLLGYPCNLDSCQKMHQVTAQSARAVSPNNVEYGSDMTGGSSGGPWVQNFGELASGQTGGLNPGLNRVIGVTSYGYISSSPKAQGSSVPDGRFLTLLNTICAHQAGNCS